MTKPKAPKNSESSEPRRARTWVLDTETKGTGAEMVPLERALRRAEPRTERIRVIRRKPRGSPRAPRDEPASETSQTGPRRFKIVDVMSGKVLAEHADIQATLDLLKARRSVVDARVYVWDEQGEDWRPLSLREQQALRDLRNH
jgi:hypothetical protein